MKFSENWLRSVFDPGMTSEELADVLTMAGLEVEAREPVAPGFDGIVVARVASLQPHPDAERLKICVVDVGGEMLQVVCGAPNVRAGMRVACARPGAKLPAMTVQRVELRGVESHGMLCSERELALGDDHSGVIDLGDDAIVGTDVRDALDLDDHVFTLKLTPNRGDCLSIQGLARELAALTGKPYRGAQEHEVAATLADEREITLEAGGACPRYCGRIVAGVDSRAPTPQWMVRRLRRSGVRPVSAVVDITNYVMLETGQPLHAFDLEHIEGGVHVRFATPGEQLALLDGRHIELQPKHLVIADDSRPLALAGVMGGETSGVGEATASVFLESAYFAPEVVAEASRGLEITSDAAHRFERGVDFALARRAIERATELILQVCGGNTGPVVEALGGLPVRPDIAFSPERVRQAIGLTIPNEEIAGILRRLGLAVSERGDEWSATPPSHRFDLAIEVDIVEEVARVHGYEHIPASLPVTRTPILPLAEHRTSVERIKQSLALRDYFEVITFSFVDRQIELDFAGESNPVRLANPIASQLSVMRSSLVGSLVECVRFNIARKQERVRVFELAACYRRDGDGYGQTDRLAGVCYGSALPEKWGEPLRPVDFYDVRGDLEAILGAAALCFVPAAHPAMHPGQSARVLFGGREAGWIGALHPRLLQKYELGASTIAFELDLDVVRDRDLPTHRPVSRFPPVRRDFALVVDDSVQAAALQETIRSHGAPLVIDVTLFDVYRGKGVPNGRKSLAFRVLLQDTEKTLTDAEVEAVVQRVVMILEEKHGAALRT